MSDTTKVCYDEHDIAESRMAYALRRLDRALTLSALLDGLLALRRDDAMHAAVVGRMAGMAVQARHAYAEAHAAVFGPDVRPWHWDWMLSELDSVSHTRDEDCTVVDGQCTLCGVSHGPPCLGCYGCGYHRPGCPEAEESVETT